MLVLPASRPKAVGVVLLAAIFVAAGVNHFIMPAVYVAMMPAYLPAHLELVYLSGAFEVVGGGAVLLPKLRRAAGWGLIALLVAVFPANVNMALHPDMFPGLPPLALWVRLPIQGLLIGWVFWATQPNREDRLFAEAEVAHATPERRAAHPE